MSKENKQDKTKPPSPSPPSPPPKISHLEHDPFSVAHVMIPVMTVQTEMLRRFDFLTDFLQCHPKLFLSCSRNRILLVIWRLKLEFRLEIILCIVVLFNGLFSLSSLLSLSLSLSPLKRPLSLSLSLFLIYSPIIKAWHKLWSFPSHPCFWLW